jgi:predicted chitinase
LSEVRHPINGGAYGLAERKKYYARVRVVLV